VVPAASAIYAICLGALAMSAQETQAGRGVNFYSTEKEAALGAQLAKDIRQHTTPLDNAAILAYVESTGNRLAAQLPNRPFPYTFALIADGPAGPPYEPLSFPGGYIFVPASLIVAAQNEAEFAGMLAIAMAHIAERQGTREATREALRHNASIPLVFIGGSTGLGASGYDPAVPRAFVSMVRSHEIEADALALKLMSGAGYDPEALATYIGREQPPDSEKTRLYSTLPPRGARIAAMQKVIAEFPPRTYTSGGSDFLRMQAETRRTLKH
jgi:predicted Zn-dependent protease